MNPPARPLLDTVLAILSGTLLAFMMIGTFADVIARYLFSRPIKGAFELTELSLLVLIFLGLPLVSRANEHVTMDFIDKILPGKVSRAVQRLVHLFCGLVLVGLTWQVWIKAGKIAGYGDTTDVLKVPVGPFVYLMAVMVGVTAAIHLYKAVAPRGLDAVGGARDPTAGATS